MEDENRRLKQMVADISLDEEALKPVTRKRLEFASLRAKVAFVQSKHDLSERRTRNLLRLSDPNVCIV